MPQRQRKATGAARPPGTFSLPRTGGPTLMFHLRVSPAERADLDARASAEGVSASALVRAALWPLDAPDSSGQSASGEAKGVDPSANMGGVHPYVGRLYSDGSRWQWAVRFDAAAHPLDGGGRWEPVATVAAILARQ